jgi:hypothetical protein
MSEDSRRSRRQIPYAGAGCVRPGRPARLALSLVLGTALPLLAVGLGAVQGCSVIELPGRDAGVPSSMLVQPASVTLKVKNDKIEQVQFKALADIPGVDASPKDVTDSAEWRVEDPSLGSFDQLTRGLYRTEIDEGGTKVAVRHGGTVQITAKYANFQGQAFVTIEFEKDWVVAGAPADAAKKFGGNKAGTISFHYPQTGTLVPPNLGQMEVQYTKGNTSNDLFKITYTSPMARVRVFTTKNSHNLGVKAWPGVGLTSAGEDVKITVEGTNSSNTNRKWVSDPLTLKIAAVKVLGGLYYWDVTPPEGIYRYDFENPTASSSSYYTRREANDCVGCHALSPGGERLALTRTGGGGDADMLDVKTRTSLVGGSYNKYKGDLHTFSKNGDEVIVVHQGVLRRRKVADGSELERIPTSSFKSCTGNSQCSGGETCFGTCSRASRVCKRNADCAGGESCVNISCRMGQVTHPDWSPDGSKLVFVGVAPNDYHQSDKGYPIFDDVHFRRGSIYLMTNSEGKWSKPRLLVASSSGNNNYYPTFSPKGDWIAFNRSSGDSYSDSDANIFIIRPDGKKLTKLNRLSGSKTSNSWPRWSPFVQTYNGRTIYWVTFSSLRDYGVKLKNSAIADYSKKIPQIWMAAFDPRRAESGSDPVFPPFWLPFQNIKDHNHIAQWTQKVVAVQ